MSPESDIEIIEEQPHVKVWGEGFDKIQTHKAYKGKFVVTDDGKLFAKLYPKADWDKVSFFHNELMNELGVKDAESPDVKEIVTGGGKIEIELVDDYIECRLYGKSTIYGEYNSEDIDTTALEAEIRKVFDLDERPILAVPDFEK